MKHQAIRREIHSFCASINHRLWKFIESLIILSVGVNKKEVQKGRDHKAVISS